MSAEMRYAQRRLLEIKASQPVYVPARVKPEKPPLTDAEREAQRLKMIEWQRAWRQTPQGRASTQRANLRQVHNITIEQYDALWDACRGRCSICGDPMVKAYTAESTGQRGPQRGAAHIDHDHACCPRNRSCGRCIRGLLCTRCNQGLAAFRDRPQLLSAAAAYLTGNQRTFTDE
jgi:Recombination endonuclease VII